jgi:hypothetical protein
VESCRVDERVDDENCEHVRRKERPDGDSLALGGATQGYPRAVRRASTTYA